MVPPSMLLIQKQVQEQMKMQQMQQQQMMMQQGYAQWMIDQ